MKETINIIRIALIVFIILGIGLFVLYNSRIFIAGPQIEIYSPKNGASFTSPLIELKGNAKNIAFISLDDHPIFIDEEGNFKEKLLLSPGVSIIKVYAKDKFERDKSITLQYVYIGTSTPLSEVDIEIEGSATSTATTTDLDKKNN